MLNKLKFIIILFVFAAFSNCISDTAKYKVVTKKDKNGYTYESVTNDPFKARIYTLENGLKVYLSVNKDEPRIMTFIPVKAGSTYDPKETTGLAHYLEHMMFKGSSKIGTIDWEKEEILLNEISDLYEKHKATDNADEKKVIYAKIDSVSAIAAKHAIANEYDKLVKSVGAKNTNAYTTNERTVYMNNIPSNELEKWLKLEKERFSKLVLRLFHTELEAVYEEFNMSQDNDRRKENKAFMAGMFKNHPYGTQTTLGKAEHIKNPSMENLHKYWNTYYVPNNIAMCMSGDLDFENTIQLIDKYWGKLEPGDVPEFEYPVCDSITEPVITEVFGPQAEDIIMGYRCKGYNSKDRKYMTLISSILSNQQAGLIDLNLVQKQKVLDAGAYSYFLKDYGLLGLYGNPREGQTLEEVKDLLLEEIEKVKKGEFEDWLIEAVINDFKLGKIKSRESNWRAHEFAYAFSNSTSWIDYISFNNGLEEITKDDIVAYANKMFKENYVVTHKRTGKDENVIKIDKPQITAVPINRTDQSEFFKELTSTVSDNLEPVFVDFEKEITTTNLDKNIEISYLYNPSNELFSMNYIIDMGKDHNSLLPIAFNYLPYLGTDKYTAAELQQEFFKLGLSMNVYTGDERSYIFISGLEKSVEQGIQLLEHILSNVKPDKKALDDYIDGILKERTDNKLNKNIIMFRGLLNYGVFGKNSSFTNLLSEDELKALKAEDLTNLIKDIYSYKHRLFYYGKNDINKVKSILTEYHKVPSELKEYPEPQKYTEQNTDENIIYFVNYDMVQSFVMTLAKDQAFNKKVIPEARLFNEFYGSGLSSIVFQEIRESKALAYSAFASYIVPRKTDRSHYLYTYVSTQPDKLKTATSAMLDLMNNMPDAEEQFNSSKETIIKKIETERIIKSNIFWTYQRNLDRGINYDIRKDVYEKMKTTTPEEFEKFFNEHIKDKKYTYLILGNKENIDMEMLSKIGKAKELTLEDIFNY
ncbi:MAG: insulinase family protein [Bacteroidales bacterium]|nr:insulinase family protein [Bacteroidales bacterium]